MNRHPISLRQLAIAAGFAVSCFTLMLLLWSGNGGPIPLKPSPYRVHVSLAQAGSLGLRSDVRSAGVSIGHVVSVSVRPSGRVDVLVELKPPFVPLRADTRARVRQKTILGENYLDLQLGGGRPIPEGGSLALTQARETVAADEILESFDPRTRQALQLWQQTVGAAVAPHGQDLNAALGTLRPWAIDASGLLAIVEQQGQDVSALLRDGGAVASGLADRGDSIRRLARSGDRAFEATGREADSLQSTFTALPGFERETQRTLQRLTEFASVRTDDVRTLRAELQPLSRASQSLAARAPALRRVLGAAPALSRAGRTALPRLDELLAETPPFLAELDPFLRSLNPALREIAGGRTNLTSALANVAAATQAAIPTTDGALLHYARTMPVLSPTGLAPLATVPGVARANAYPLNGRRDLAAGLSVFDARSCGAPTPPVSGAPSPLIDQSLRDQLDAYVYTPSAQNIAAPRCRAQGPVPGFGTSFPALVSDP